MASVDTDPATGASPSPAGTGRPHRPVVAVAAIAAAIVAVDQLTKWWAIEALTDPRRVIHIVWTLRFNLLYNRGTAFSLTDNSGPVVSAIAVVVVVVLVRSARHQRSGLVLASYGLVMGGTLGNVVDRLFRSGTGFLGGGVVDFVDPQWFPVFNVADAALTIGIALLLVAGFFTDAFDDAPGEADVASTGEGDDIPPPTP